jgi:hypothetical protein
MVIIEDFSHQSCSEQRQKKVPQGYGKEGWVKAEVTEEKVIEYNQGEVKQAPYRRGTIDTIYPRVIAYSAIFPSLGISYLLLE